MTTTTFRDEVQQVADEYERKGWLHYARCAGRGPPISTYAFRASRLTIHV
jgi:hypothetical protein